MQTLSRSLSKLAGALTGPGHNCAILRAALFAVVFCALLSFLLRLT